MENPSRMRFEVGTQKCGVCGTKHNVIQFERETKRKGIPIIEIAFICIRCAKKNHLIRDSKTIKK